MPNQRDPEKRLIGYQARKEVRDAIDQYARDNGLATRAEALEHLLVEALAARGVKIPDRVYLPDARAKKKDPSPIKHS